MVSGNLIGKSECEKMETKRIEELLNMPYWIIDILPMQVPKNSAGQYFTIEKFFLDCQLPEIKQKHLNVVLKLNCYIDIVIDSEINPPPDKLKSEMLKRHVHIMVGDSMILSEPDDTHMTIFHPDEALLELVKCISASEGLYVWKP